MTRWSLAARATMRWLPALSFAIAAACGDPAQLSSPDDLSASFAKPTPQPAPSLTVTITTPAAFNASVVVSGPRGYSQPLSATQTLSGLRSGTYTISATSVSSGGITYVPTPATQTVNVGKTGNFSATVTYSAAGVVPGDFNLTILGMTLTQSVQTLNNTVTLVANRAGVLRVFAVATAANSATPQVRARFYINSVLQQTLTQNAPTASVPTALNEASATASWNFSVPATLIQPGLSVLVDVDPTNTVVEASETDNVYPTSGAAFAFTVRTVNPLSLRFVPVASPSVNTVGTTVTGNVSVSNGNTFLLDTRDMLPVETITWDVRSPYSTSNQILSDGTGWSPTLSEVSALKSTDGRASWHYYGVVKAEYGGGVAGMGYIGSATSIGWDYLPSGSGVMAHELGHNFGRYHAPCGGPSGVDQNYPYAGGIIGVYGWNVRTNTLIPSSRPDLMTYCSNEWISDYNYNAIMSYRGFAASASVASVFASNQPQDGVLVWGRVARDGNIVLEPALALSAPVNLPPSGGSHTLDALDAAGRTLFTMSFTPTSTADGGDVNDAHFSYVIPLSKDDQARVATIRVRGNGREAVRTASQSPVALAAAAASANLSAVGANRARVQWDAATFPMIIVRETDTGDILSFARGGDLSLLTDRAELDVIVTDGVRSAQSRVRVRGR